MSDSQKYIRQERERRQRKHVTRQTKAERLPSPYYYEGHDGGTDMPLVRPTGGIGAPLSSLSNMQADIGQQGRVIAGSFDTGRFEREKNRRRRITPVDAIYSAFYTRASGNYFKILSDKNESPEIPESDLLLFGIYRPSEQSPWDDIEAWGVVLPSFGQTVYVVDRINVATASRTTILTVSNQLFPAGNTTGLFIVADMAIGFSLNTPGDATILCGVAYPDFFTSLPFEFNTANGDGDFVIVGPSNAVGVAGLPSFRVSSQVFPKEEYSLLRAASKNGDWMVYTTTDNGNFADDRYKGESNGFSFDVPPGSPFPVNAGEIGYFIYSSSGDLNFVSYPTGLPGSGVITVKRLCIVNGVMVIGQTKTIPIPAKIREATELRWVNLPNSALISTGRGVTP